MKNAENYRRYLGSFLLLFITLLSARLFASTGQISMGDSDPKFPLLQTRTGAYTNVTVTKRTKDWIFILHSQGVCNIKASDLSTEARLALGYDAPPTKEGEEKAAETAPGGQQPIAAIAKSKFAELKKFVAGLKQNQKEEIAQVRAYIAANPMVICSTLGGTAVFYLFFSICCWLICRKTHIAPGMLVWIPFLQLIPLMRAANMPRIWFFGFFIPFIQIIPMISLCIKLVKARGKGPWTAFCLILPPTSLFAFLYLAFSSSAPVQIERVEILALETA